MHLFRTICFYSLQMPRTTVVPKLTKKTQIWDKAKIKDVPKLLSEDRRWNRRKLLNIFTFPQTTLHRLAHETQVSPQDVFMKENQHFLNSRTGTCSISTLYRIHKLYFSFTRMNVRKMGYEFAA